MLTRSEALAKAGVTDRELRSLEQEKLVVPHRSWKTLWLVPKYDFAQVDVIQWLITSQRLGRSMREREARLVAADPYHAR
jgi:DNA-binding transcriptional MerR regulator